MSRGGAILIASVAVCLAVLASAGVASAATIRVDVFFDEFFGQAEACSLRDAVQAANTDTDFGGCVRKGSGGEDTIVLQGGQTYFRSVAGVDDTNAAGDLDITGRTIIKVKGEGMATVDANDMDRVIQVHPGARLEASRLVVQDGSTASGVPGGGIYSQGRLSLTSSSALENTATGIGGGIATDRRAELRKIVVRENQTTSAGGGIAFTGGRLTLLRSTVAGNDAASGGGGMYLVDFTPGGSISLSRTTISDNDDTGESTGGGGIFVGAPDTRMTATNVTISGNRSNTRGGGIYEREGTLKLNAATITANTADANGDGGGTVGGSGGGVYDVDGATRNSIIVGNFATNAGGEDCYTFFSEEHNLVGAGTGCPESGSNLATSDPKLEPLADNGGPTETHALMKGSPAIGLAAGSAPAKDQRGVKRDHHPDSGAYER